MVHNVQRSRRRQRRNESALSNSRYVILPKQPQEHYEKPIEKNNVSGEYPESSIESGESTSQSSLCFASTHSSHQSIGESRSRFTEIFIEVEELAALFLRYIAPTDAAHLAQTCRKYRSFYYALDTTSSTACDSKADIQRSTSICVERWWFGNCVIWLTSFPGLGGGMDPVPWDAPLPANLWEVLKEPERTRRITTQIETKRKGPPSRRLIQKEVRVSQYYVSDKTTTPQTKAFGSSWGACFARIYSRRKLTASRTLIQANMTISEPITVANRELWYASPVGTAILDMLRLRHQCWSETPVPDIPWLEEASFVNIRNCIDPKEPLIHFDLIRRVSSSKSSLSYDDALAAISSIYGPQYDDAKIRFTWRLLKQRERSLLRSKFVPLYDENSLGYVPASQSDSSDPSLKWTALYLLCLMAILASPFLRTKFWGAGRELQPNEILGLAASATKMILHEKIELQDSAKPDANDLFNIVDVVCTRWRTMLKNNAYEKSNKRHKIVFRPVFGLRRGFELLAFGLPEGLQLIFHGGYGLPSQPPVDKQSSNLCNSFPNVLDGVQFTEHERDRGMETTMVPRSFWILDDWLTDPLGVENTPQLTAQCGSVLSLDACVLLMKWCLRVSAVESVRRCLHFKQSFDNLKPSVAVRRPSYIKCLAENIVQWLFKTRKQPQMTVLQPLIEYKIDYVTHWSWKSIRVVLDETNVYIFHYFLLPKHTET